MSTWHPPLDRMTVTSRYNLQRVHPIFRYPRPHTGTDYRAPTGTPVYAVADGVVERSAYDRPRILGGTGAGHHIRLNHGSGVTSRYYHLSQRHVAVGQRVKAGQRIGLAGSTGDSTAAHLHFEIRIDGAHTDPHAYLSRRLTPVSNPRPTTPTTPAPPIERDWFDMATKAEVQEAFAAANAPLVDALGRIEAHLKERLDSDSHEVLGELRTVREHLKVRLNSNSADTLNVAREIRDQGK